MEPTLIFIGIVVLLAIVLIARAVNIVQQGYVGVVKRLGQFHSVRQPGVTFLIPLVDAILLVDIRETPRTGDKQDVITRDNVTVSVNATIFSQVVDPKLALFSVSNYVVAIDQLSRTTLRAILEAEGRAQAVATVYKAIIEQNPTPTLVSILQLDTLSKFATSDNSKILVPFESAGLMGAAQALRGVLDAAPAGGGKS